MCPAITSNSSLSFEAEGGYFAYRLFILISKMLSTRFLNFCQGADILEFFLWAALDKACTGAFLLGKEILYAKFQPSCCQTEVGERGDRRMRIPDTKIYSICKKLPRFMIPITFVN